MKNIFPILICVLSILAESCHKDLPDYNREKGSLHVDIGLSIHVNELSSDLKSSQQTEGFSVLIFRADGTQVMSFDSAGQMPDTIELETGFYYVEAHSDNNLPAAFDNPYYAGVSDTFAINSNSLHSVRVNCRLANTIVSVAYSVNVENSFSDYSATVSSALGSLLFGRDEIRLGYFQPLPLDIMVELIYQDIYGSDTSKTLTGQIPEPLPNRHYEIRVDAGVDGGMASFQVQLDTSDIPVEIIEITDDPGSPQSGELAYGELLITEIMYNPDTLTDTQGEWFEVYNNSQDAINLHGLILGRDDANRHIIADSIELQPSAYFVFKKTTQATDSTTGYVYGSDILLPNTGAVLSIFNAGTMAEPGELIFAVDYGGADFPEGTGASICLDPNLLNPGDAVLGISWCLSSSVYSTGDLGTPGSVNDPCQ
jgi:hypothetical protein